VGSGITTYTIAPNLRAPYTVQAVASVERQITKTSTLSVSYIHSHGVHQFFSINSAVVDAIQKNIFNPASPPPPVYQYQSEGIFNQNQLITNFNVRAGAKLTIFSFYSFSHANSDTAGAGNFPTNPANISADYGRAGFDVHHRLFFGGTISLPHGFRVSPFMVANSGSPFNITTGQDLNGDSIFNNDRPAFASSTTLPGDLRQTSFGNFDIAPAAGTAPIPVNFGTTQAQFTLNMRLSKTIGIGPKLEAANNGNNSQQDGQHGGNPRGGGPGGPGGPRGGGPGGPGGGGPGGGGRGGPGGFGGERSNQRYSLTFSANARNIFNNVNPGQPIGNLSSSSFGRATSLAAGVFNTQSANRRIDLQVMFSF